MCLDRPHFECHREGITQDGEEFEDDCAEDFMRKDFWSVMREEKWWIENADEELYGFYSHWEYYHGFEEKECDLVFFNEDCDNFAMLRQDNCIIEA